MDDPGFPDRFEDARRPGAYLRIFVEGALGVGDDVVLVHRPGHGVTIEQVAMALIDQSLAASLAGAKELPAAMLAWATEAAAEAASDEAASPGP